jgi:hypothetical protein
VAAEAGSGLPVMSVTEEQAELLLSMALRNTLKTLTIAVWKNHFLY